MQVLYFYFLQKGAKLLEKNILSQISADNVKLSKGQRLIARYISDNYDKAAFMTAGKLGRTVGVSESTVVRFATELGYEGYPEMRKALQELVRNRLTSVQRIAAAREMMDSANVLKSVMGSDMEKLRVTLESLDRTSFESAVDAILSARKLYILGMRSSAALASFLRFYLNYLMDNVHAVSDAKGSEVYEQMLRIGPEDVLFCISFPRYTSNSLRAARFAKERGARIVTLTDNDSSPFAQIADVVLYAKSDMVSFLDSLVAPLSVLNAIVIAVGARRRETLDETFENLETLWAEYEVFTDGES